MIDKLQNKNEISQILSKLNSNEQTGFIVGGAVRDLVMNKTPKDVDITTSYDYDSLVDIFKNDGYKLYETGKVFGVLRIKTQNNEYEIAQYRQDINNKDISDNRRPDAVNFVENIEDDLSRRDFTINAMAWNTERGIVDLFGGQKDIENRQVRFVGDPNERIQEDALRIMRAFRFSARFDFEIEENTLNAISENKELINTLAKERVHDEFTKIMKSDNYMKAVDYMAQTGVLFELFPDLELQVGYNQNNPYHSLELWEHTREVVKGCQDSDYLTRISALFHDIGKPFTKSVDEETGYFHFYDHENVGAEKTRDIMNEFRFSTAEKNVVTKLVENHMTFHRSETDKTIRRLILNIGEENTKRLAELAYADDDGKGYENRHNYLLEKVENVIERMNVPTVNTIALSGYDLMELGFKNKEIGVIKKYLLNEIIDNGIENEKDTLMKIVENEFLNKDRQKDKVKEVKYAEKDI